MSNYKELLIGCGHSREKRVLPPGHSNQWASTSSLVTLDNNSVCKPDILMDLSNPLELAVSFAFDAEFDEIHAYEVLEHIGAQGDYKLFFGQFAAFYRWLKPNGYFCATVPHWKSIWAFGDPGHTRVISAASLVFLDQDEYVKQLGVTPMSDYRGLLRTTNFKRVSSRTLTDTYEFVLQAVK